MNRLAAFASMLVLLAAPAFGKSTKTQTVVIPQSVQVGSTQLPAGTYKLAYTGSGSDVQVTLTQARKMVLTFAAKAVEQTNNPASVDVNTIAGVATLEAINLDKISLHVEDAPHPGQ
jgi:hypothetical protein